MKIKMLDCLTGGRVITAREFESLSPKDKGYAVGILGSQERQPHVPKECRLKSRSARAEFMCGVQDAVDDRLLYRRINELETERDILKERVEKMESVLKRLAKGMEDMRERAADVADKAEQAIKNSGLTGGEPNAYASASKQIAKRIRAIRIE